MIEDNIFEISIPSGVSRSVSNRFLEVLKENDRFLDVDIEGKHYTFETKRIDNDLYIALNDVFEDMARDYYKQIRAFFTMSDKMQNAPTYREAIKESMLAYTLFCFFIDRFRFIYRKHLDMECTIHVVHMEKTNTFELVIETDAPMQEIAMQQEGDIYGLRTYVNL